jgi:phosphate transport system substrate-binding protein
MKPVNLRGRQLFALTVTIICFLLLTGCLGGGGKTRLTQTGSSTVLPLAIIWAEEFDDADISVSGGGSSHGLNALLNDEADLADASRLMKGKDYEKVDGDPDLVKEDGTAQGKAPTGVWPHKWIVAYDVLVVVVNNQNHWATQLNYSQLYKIFTDDHPAVYWDAVPGLDSAPHKKIEIYSPDEASGTYDFFFEEIIPNWGKATQTVNTRLDSGDGVYHPSSDDNVILNAIKDNEYAIGYFGFSYFKENPQLIKPVWISHEGEQYQEPSLENVANYPLARPLHIYTDGIPNATGGEKEKAVNSYLRFVLGEKGQGFVPEAGYVKLSLINESLISDQLLKL